jgi:hypothetical protein
MRPSTLDDRHDRLPRHESLESRVRGKLAGAVRRGADRKGPPLSGTSLAAYPTRRGADVNVLLFSSNATVAYPTL